LSACFALLSLALALLERVGLEADRTPQLIAAGALVLFVLVAALANGRRPADHYLAAQEVSSRLGGVATAGAIAGLVVLAMSGPEAATGSGLLSLILGVFVGLAFLSFSLAPRLRAAQAYGPGDFLGARFGLGARLLGRGRRLGRVRDALLGLPQGLSFQSLRSCSGWSGTPASMRRSGSAPSCCCLGDSGPSSGPRPCKPC
jgi:hypothetical protein